MNMNKELQNYMMQELEHVINIGSPSGYTKEGQSYLVNELTSLGFSPQTLHKGGVICEIGGTGNALMLAAHMDTLGAMVNEIKGNGALKVSRIGGLNPSAVETETVTIVTRDGRQYEGTFQIENASAHVNKDASKKERDFDMLEIVIDEKVYSADDTRGLGIENGDIVIVNPKFVVTSKGFIKSRFLDDKASVAILLALAKAVSTKEIILDRKIYLNFTVYEEVGHGGAAGIPSDVKDIISVDMGCVGTGLQCKETQVSICSADSGGPYNYDVTSKLIQLSKENDIDYAVDIYPFYGSDVETTLRAGYDIRHGLIGPGVYASHGYERSHIDGLTNTYDLLAKYCS